MPKHLAVDFRVAVAVGVEVGVGVGFYARLSLLRLHAEQQFSSNALHRHDELRD